MTRVYDEGSIVGDHTLVERLGAGGFGEVWRAKRLPDGEDRAEPGEPVDVALKIASEPGRARSLKREAALAAELDHPGVVRTFRVRLDLDPPHLVLELVKGVDLRRRLTAKGGKLPWQGAVRIVADAVEAVAHAHRRGIVHGDVKPENILLEKRTGLVRVTDFGLGRDVGSAAGASLSLSFSKSIAGVAGTLSYMAPEMLEGAKATKATDVYALGAVLYEAVTGAPPAGAFLLPSELDWALPDELDRVLDRALDGDPDARPKDAGGLLRTMKALLAAAGPDPRAATRPKPTRKATAAETHERLAARKAKKGEPACPRCAVRLCRARYSGVRVRACPRCRGVWLERRPLERLLDRRHKDRLEKVPTEKAAPGPEAALPCVSCPRPMDKFLLGSGSVEATLVDICRGHGVWFDPGEVERAIAVFSRSPFSLVTILSRLGHAVGAGRDGNVPKKAVKKKRPATKKKAWTSKAPGAKKKSKSGS